MCADTPSNVVAIESSPKISFAEHVRKTLLAGLNDSSSSNREADQFDINFLTQLNTYFEAEGLEPIQVPTKIPESVEKHMRDALHYKRITDPKHPFVAQDEVQGRANNAQRQGNLATLYDALRQYRIAKDVRFNPQPEELKLWKHVATLQEGKNPPLHSSEPADTIDFNDRVVIIAPGSSKLHSEKDSLVECFKQVELMLGGKGIYDLKGSEKVTCYAVTYPNLGRAAQEADIFATNANPYEHVSPMVQQWVDNTLLPSLGLNNGEIKSQEALEQSFMKLRFYGISYGSVMIEQIRNAMTKTLLAQGYSKEQLALAFPKAYAVNNMPVHRLEREAPVTGSFQTLNFVSDKDVVAKSYADYGAFVRQDGDSSPPPSTLRQIHPQSWLYWDNAPASGIHWGLIDEGYLGIVPDADSNHPTYEWMIPNGSFKQQGHNSWIMAAKEFWEPLKHGAKKLYSGMPIHFSLRKAVSGDPMPDDLTQTFAPYYLIEPSHEERAKTAHGLSLPLQGAICA